MIVQASTQRDLPPGLVEDKFVNGISFVPSFDSKIEAVIDMTSLNDLVQAWCNIKDRRSGNFCWKDYVQYSVIKLDHSRQQAVLRPSPIQTLGNPADVPCGIDSWQTKATKLLTDSVISREYSPRLDDIMGIENSLTQRKWQRMSVLDASELPCMLSYFQDQTAIFGHYDVLSNDTAQHILRTGLQTNSGETKTYKSPTVWSASSEHRSGPDCRRPIPPPLNETEVWEKVGSAQVPSFNTRACSLKLSFNAHDLREARHLHDQLCVLSPITLALTANSPGYDSDLAHAQQGFDLFSHRQQPVTNMREFSARKEPTAYPTYLSADALRFGSGNNHADHNIFHYLRSCGIDDAMAVLCAQQTTFRDTLVESNTGPLSFFASLNRHVELRPPSTNDSTSAFCVNLDAMEMQLTDFANAACIFFVVMLRFAVLGFDLDFRISPSQVAENLDKAETRDAVLVEKFWWRMPRWRMRNLTPFSNEQSITTDAEPALLSIDHIVNGDPSRPETIGLSGVVEAYLADIDDGSSAGGSVEDLSSLYEPRGGELSRISGYLALIRQRAKGTLPTHAQWTRRFIEGRLRDREWCISRSELLYDLFGAVNDLNIAASSGFGF